VLKDKRDKSASDAAAVVIITDKDQLSELTKDELEKQLSAHRLLDTSSPKLIPCKSNLKNNTQRREHLFAAVDRYVADMGEE
jgi:hypothetical protein